MKTLWASRHKGSVFAIAVVVALPGCATMTDGLKSINDATRPKSGSSARQVLAPTSPPAPMSRTEQLLYSNGQPAQTVTITIRGKPCDVDRYINNWEAEYVVRWNQIVNSAVNKYLFSKTAADQKTRAELSAQILKGPKSLPSRTYEEAQSAMRDRSCSVFDESYGDGGTTGWNDALAKFSQYQ